ncbi:hypothetical protein GmHk_04G010312 [Glycine max]|nr:hypothetical protein GmHk_04G010312 [Glycine max]
MKFYISAITYCCLPVIFIIKTNFCLPSLGFGRLSNTIVILVDGDHQRSFSSTVVLVIDGHRERNTSGRAPFHHTGSSCWLQYIMNIFRRLIDYKGLSIVNQCIA